MVAFLAMAFDLDLPPVESLPVPEIAGWIDAVGREITDALDLAATSPELTEVTYRPYLSTDIEGPQMDRKRREHPRGVRLAFSATI